MKRLVFSLLGWALAILALPMGMAGGIVAFFASAYGVSSPWVISLAGVLGCFLVAAGFSWLSSRWIAPHSRLRMTLGVGSGVALLAVLISAVTIFKPLAPIAAIDQDSRPSAVRYWDLPTGSHIAYLRVPAQGARHGEPIVFLHGGPGAGVVSAGMVTDVVSQFSRDGYDIYFYDQIGGGLSARLEDVRHYTLHRHIEDLEAIRRAIGAGSVILMGESFGGVLAAHYIAHHPKRVSRCVLISPGALVATEWKDIPAGAPLDRVDPERKKAFRGKIRSHLPRLFLGDLLRDINPAAGKRFISDAEGDRFISDAFSGLLAGFTCDPGRMPANASIHFGFWANQMIEGDRRPCGWDVRAMLSASATPVLVLKGECDYIKWQVTWQYRNAFPRSTLLCIPGAGHMPYLEQRDDFLSCVRAFLADAPLPLPPCTEGGG